MIRMAYLDDTELCRTIINEYEKRMNTTTLKKNWRGVKAGIPELHNFNFTLKTLLTSPFGQLLNIAKAFDKALNEVNNERKIEIKTLLKERVFRYDSYYQKKKIAPFFREYASELKLHTCHYCDMAYINTYEYVDKANGHRKKACHFDLDHIIEKADYPFLAFSLFNLVPSCPICNERLKVRKSFSKANKLLKKFSPTSQDFYFDRIVDIELMPLEDVKRPYMDNASAYEIVFDCHKDKDYEKYIECFRLKERYNYHKSEALRLKDLQLRYPDSNLADIASLLHIPYDEVKEDIFGLRFVKENHRCFSKLKKDILK